MSSRQPQAQTSATSNHVLKESVFCHTFDLTRRFDLMAPHKINYYAVGSSKDPFTSLVTQLALRLASAHPTSIHRIAIPLVLLPAIYPPTACRPENILRFIHALRSLLRQYSGQATAMLSIPLSLFPRSSSLTHMMEQLCDGVIELLPFPYIAGYAAPDAGAKKDTAQGMLRVLSLPLVTARGEGGAGGGNSIGDDLSFTLSRKKFVIEPFSLPPMEGDQEAQSEAGKISAKDVEF